MTTTQQERRRKFVPELSKIAIGPENIDDFINSISRLSVDPDFVIIDLFCGAGGTSTGFHMAGSSALVIACVNHDAVAIKSHWANYPHVAHFEEDIRILDLRTLLQLVRFYREMYPNAKLVLWASLECTNFSKAKGGQPRDADSRTLADHLLRYIHALSPDYVQIENVVEFMSWGPLDENGKPISKRSGSDWMRWREEINAIGYRDEWREMNSADFGAFTSRNRLFGIFAKPGMPIAWPEPTHSKSTAKSKKKHHLQQQLFQQGLKPWKAVKEVLDFEDEGTSIFNRKKSLVDASLERIYAGLVKFVAGGKDAFILKYNSTNSSGVHHPPSIDDPCPTIACQNRLGIVNAAFLAKHFSGSPGNKVQSIETPAGSITCVDHHSLVQTSFLAKYYSGKPAGKVISVEGPAGTICAMDTQALVSVSPFVLNTQFNNGARSVDEPASTLVASRRHPYLVNPSFLTQYYSSGGQLSSVDEPARTLGTKDTIAKIQASWFDKTYSGTGNVSSVENPAGALMPCDKHRLINCSPIILNPSHGGHCTSSDQPGPTIVARQDKAPLYLIQFKIDPNVHIPVYEGDSDVMVRIKLFMALYGIADIKMRMLKVSELLKIQGFPDGYILEGSQTDQKKFIGNSVVPQVVKHWIAALSNEVKKIAA